MSSFVVKIRAEKGLLLGGCKVHESAPLSRKWAEAWAEAVVETNLQHGRHAVLVGIREVKPDGP